MNFLKSITFIILLFLSTSSFASDEDEQIWVHRYMWSHHFDDKDLNETHNLIGLEYNDWLVARYYNSDYRNTTLIAKYFDKCTDISIFNACGGLLLGVANGYTYINDGDYAPYAIPTLRLSYKRLGIELNGIPSVMALQFIFRID